MEAWEEALPVSSIGMVSASGMPLIRNWTQCKYGEKRKDILLKTLRFVSVLCAALVVVPTLTHDLEVVGKRQLSGEEWLQVQHTFSGGFALVGGVGEMLDLIPTGVLTYLLRKRRTGFILTLIAALCFADTLAVFAFGNQSINQYIATWTPRALPATWRQARDVWDAFHAARSVLVALAFVTLLIALLRDILQKKSSIEK